MNYQTIKVDLIEQDILSVTIDRLEDNNTLNNVLINELLQVITTADSAIKIIILQGQQGVFCTGMDFKAMAENKPLSREEAYAFSSKYMELLTTFTTVNKVIVAKLDGKVLAGGTGLVAAADLVYSSPRTTFSLSEALWGLLPANVMPFLVRRVGFQMAYRMTLTTEVLNATQAQQCHLIDEILEQIDDQLMMKLVRIRRLQSETILDLKNYFKGMNLLTEENCQHAINTLATLMVNPRIQTNIKNFVQHGTFPWSQGSN